MKESKDLYQANLMTRKKQESIENLKEDPRFLEQREQQERELSNKRNSERKMIDEYHIRHIENKQKYLAFYLLIGSKRRNSRTIKAMSRAPSRFLID